ncbi:MAG: RluA family pseudouridine synthase [Clostridiales Family XIII bacterium]|nr:RluA family pseudouridine synthase [Clostridiales Family XIII bacterium]
MHTITISETDEGQRLDRYLKKFLSSAPLSLIYKICRKDAKVNGQRRQVDYMMQAGDELTLYLTDDRIGELSRRKKRARSKRQFGIIYEDDRILVVSKPFGLLTHGDSVEKKDTLVNQVSGYLLDKGFSARTFTPSPVNRLDRNTTGIVVFGKDPKAIRDFSAMIRHGGDVDKYYLTLAAGEITETLDLRGRMVKDEATNTVRVLPEDSDEGRFTHTVARPVKVFTLRAGEAFTLTEVLLVTGRPHQIRADLAAAGHPVIGDRKYGDAAANRYAERKFSLPAQFLHASRLHVNKGHESLDYLAGMDFESPLPENLAAIVAALEGGA